MDIINKRRKPTKSNVYDTYWKFASKRQDVFFNRIAGNPFPWTDDKILIDYKFTNVYRSSDRVSQFLINNVIYKGDQSPEEVLFRIMIYKMFNRISTWEAIEKHVGEVSYRNYSFKEYDYAIMNQMSNKIPVYSQAYMMTGSNPSFTHQKKHRNHLDIVKNMVDEGVADILAECDNFENVNTILFSYPSIGEFLAYQFATDINYSNIIDFDEMSFVKAGPGARDGINKCFDDYGDYSFEDIIMMMADIQEKEFERLGLEFKTLFGRRMQLIDCQNVFCEVDKYSRVAHPESLGYSKRIKIKQKYSFQSNEKPELFFPPKWNINHLIP